jgi:hypothetical protein
MLLKYRFSHGTDVDGLPESFPENIALSEQFFPLVNLSELATHRPLAFSSSYTPPHRSNTSESGSIYIRVPNLLSKTSKQKEGHPQ